MSERGDAGELDAATDRAASAARTLAAIAHDAASQYVQRNAVPADTDGRDANMVAHDQAFFAAAYADTIPFRLAIAERDRQDRLRRWQQPPNPTRKAG